ncbi:MAG: hypothetical protein P4L22_01815 [Candidatus Babeliales bacterium]|nr:hypothetical protein [Candidatus Babeliales bacterium]
MKNLLLIYSIIFIGTANAEIIGYAFLNEEYAKPVFIAKQSSDNKFHIYVKTIIQIERKVTVYFSWYDTYSTVVKSFSSKQNLPIELFLNEDKSLKKDEFIVFKNNGIKLKLFFYNFEELPKLFTQFIKEENLEEVEN